MRSIVFSFQASVPPEQQQKILDQVSSWEDITQAKQLKPDAKRVEIRCMAHAYLKDEADAAEVVKRLSELPEIESESVAIPAERGLPEPGKPLE